MLRTISIKVILIFGFGGLLSVGIGTSLHIGLSTAFQNTRELLSQTAEARLNRIETSITSRLDPVARQARLIAEAVKDGRVEMRDPYNPDTTAYLKTLLSALPQVHAIGIVSAEGITYGWIQDDGRIPTSNLSGQPAAAAWIERGRENPPPHWGPPFWLGLIETAVIIHETPLFDEQGYLGILTAAVPISGFSRELAEIDETSFVLAGRKGVLAHPLMIGWRPLEGEALATSASIYSGESALMPLPRLGDPVLERIWTADDDDVELLSLMENAQAVWVQIDDEWFAILYRVIDGYGPQSWYVGTYVSGAKAGTTGMRLVYALAAGAVVLIIAVLLSLLMARRLGQPILALADAAEAVRRDRLKDVPDFPKSRIRELASAMASFRSMIDGLAERDRIRTTLGRYVPESVAQELLSADGELAPHQAEATILFCDIVGFTALTEKLGPVRIVGVLNAYFSAMTRIVEARGGVITQFQGDAILAIFNIPIAAGDHALQACRTAMEMRDAVSRETFKGERLAVRIGVNTGTVVAGAVGAEDRLTYTVHGDAVNRAARLEALCKERDESLLIAEATARRAEGLPLEEVGTLPVRGQSTAVKVFRPARKKD